MTENEMIVAVTNRNSCTTGYAIPEKGIRREFAVGETKNLSFDELYALSNIPGGEFILRHSLIVKDKSALEMLNIITEPEYFYTEKEIRHILLNGTVDECDDMLTFGASSIGVIELAKKIAVDEQIPDTRKRKLILEKTGFNVDNAIRVNAIMEEDDAPKAEPTERKRKAAPVTEKKPATTTTRKAAPVAPKA